MGIEKNLSTLIQINGGNNSPAKEQSSIRGGRSPLLFRRWRLLFVDAKYKFIILLSLFTYFYFVISEIPSYMGWNPHYPSSVYSASRGGYAVLINAGKRNTQLNQAIAHYASCRRTDAIHVVRSGIGPTSVTLRTSLEKTVLIHKHNFGFDLNEEDNLNNRFKPIEGLRTDAIFSVDDNVIVPCRTLDFAFTVWQTAPRTMVGFVPRMHWRNEDKNGVVHYTYGGWWSVWWMGSYSMLLSKAAFFHKMYLDLYTNKMPSLVKDYVNKERNCEDIAMSFLIANATGSPPVWVKGKIYEIGSSGIRIQQGQSHRRNKCLNDFISLYGTMPLVSTRTKAVDARGEWFR